MLVIFLLFSAAMSFEMQAAPFNWNTWGDRVAKIGNEAVIFLRTNGRSAFNFLTKFSGEAGIVRGTIISVCLKKYLITRGLKYPRLVGRCIAVIIEMGFFVEKFIFGMLCGPRM